METLALFFERNIVVIYFFYGLAFFSMGWAVWLESGRTAEFRMARAMGPLAGFGIVHGLHEWFEMFQRLGRANATNVPEWLMAETPNRAAMFEASLIKTSAPKVSATSPPIIHNHAIR